MTGAPTMKVFPTLQQFMPQVDLQEGIHRTADWYRSEGLL